ncbi:hypothetical protein AAG906_004652 [Vitis piasezkii]
MCCLPEFGVEEGGAIRNEWKGIRCRSHFIVGNGRRVKQVGKDLGSWSPRFSRHLNDWEIGEVESLFQNYNPWFKDDNFSVKFLCCSYTRASRDPFPWSIIWRS